MHRNVDLMFLPVLADTAQLQGVQQSTAQGEMGAHAVIVQGTCWKWLITTCSMRHAQTNMKKQYQAGTDGLVIVPDAAGVGAAARSHLQAWEMLLVAACSCAAAADRSSVSALLAITAM